ncbi:hypothetical protein U1Q18_040780 [Sarracenia purpurea var. burkii]
MSNGFKSSKGFGNRYQTLSFSKEDYDESFPSLAGANAIRQRSGAEGSSDRSSISGRRNRDLYPDLGTKTNVSKSIIAEAWSVHGKIEVILRDKAVGEILAKVLRSEKKSLEAEFNDFVSCPDSLLPEKLVAIEARILRIKGLSPVSFGGPADSCPEASLTVQEGELSQSPSVQGLLKDPVVPVISANGVVLKEITDSEGEISDLGEEGSEDEGTELNSVVKDDDLANKDKDGDETVGGTLAQDLMGKNKLPLDHALTVFDEKSCSSSVTKLMAEAAIVEGKGKGSINGTVVESNKPDSDVEGSVAEDCSVGALTGEGNSEFTFLSAMDNVVDGGRINSDLVRVRTPSGMVEDVPKVAKFGYRSCAHLVFDEMHDEDLVHVDVSKK